MTRLMTQLKRPPTTCSAYRYTKLVAPQPHLRYMNAAHDKPLDRTPMLTLEELCAVLRTTPATIYTWRKRGQGPRAYKIGRHLLFAESDVREWLESCAAGPEPSGRNSAVGHRTAGTGW